MAPTTTSSPRYALLLLALIHASSCWDASNIWFPDPNNPVFYNMTFYQQAAQTVETESQPSENLLPATEPPRKTSWQRPRPSEDRAVEEEMSVRPTERQRPSVFRPVVEETPVRPAEFEQRPRPSVFRPMEEEMSVRPAERQRPSVFRPVVEEAPVRQTERPRPSVFRPVVEEAPVRETERPRPSVFRPVVEEARVRETERPRPSVFRPMVEEAPVRQTERQRPSVFRPVVEEAPVRQTERPRLSVFRPVVEEATVRPTETYASVIGRRTRPTTPAPERVQPSRTRQPSRNTSRFPQGVKGGSQSGTRRTPEEQQLFNNNNQQNRQPSRNPDSFPDTLVGYKTSPLTEETPIFNNNNRRNQQPSGNRLRRTQYEGVANHFGNIHERPEREYSEGPRRTGRGDAFLSAVRPEERLETTNNGIGNLENFGRTGDPDQGNRRNWNTAPSGRDTVNPVEVNLITDLETTSKRNGPSRCVWAILSCCKPSSLEIRYKCFETLGCHGAFWDTNPCSNEMTQAVVRLAGNYYNVPRSEEEQED